MAKLDMFHHNKPSDYWPGIHPELAGSIVDTGLNYQAEILSFVTHLRESPCMIYDEDFT